MSSIESRSPSLDRRARCLSLARLSTLIGGGAVSLFPCGSERRRRADHVRPSFNADGPAARSFNRWCAAHGFEPRIAFRVNDCQMTKAMVAANEGVSLIPRLMLDPPPADVVVKPVEGRGIARRISAVRLPSRYLSPATTAFLEATAEAAMKREALQRA